MNGLPKDIKLILSPTGKKEDAKWYKEKRHAIESEFRNALKRLLEQQKRQVKASEVQARFLFGIAVAVFIAILLIGKKVILVTLFTAAPLAALGFIYQVYSSMIGQAGLRKINQVTMQRDALILKITPTEKNVIDAIKAYEKANNMEGHIFHLWDGSILDITNLSISCVVNNLTKIRNIRVEWLKEVKKEQYMLNAILLHNEKHTFWGANKTEIQAMSDEAQAAVVSTVSVTLLNDSCTYWLILDSEASANTAFEMIEKILPPPVLEQFTQEEP